MSKFINVAGCCRIRLWKKKKILLGIFPNLPFFEIIISLVVIDLRCPMPHISLSELSEKIKDAVSAAFNNQPYWVVAEITDHKYYENHKRHYFTLVERRENSIVAKIQATAGPDAADALKNFEIVTGQKLDNGINVLINVSVSFHGLYGLQISVNDIDVNYTVGQLALYKRQTIHRLLTEESERIREVDGQLISDNKNLSLPIVIQNIALISSHNARGYDDFMKTMDKNGRYKLNITPKYTSVQGESNAQALVDCLKEIYTSGEAFDAVVIVRGGGSDTDFLIFDHFKVARAITRFPIPIIVGLGHAANITVTDLVAHTSTNTPSSAAEFIVQHNRDFEDRLTDIRDKIRSKGIERIREEEKKLSNIKFSLSQAIGPIITKHRDLYERSRNILIGHTTAIITHNIKLVGECRGIIINRPAGVISETKSSVLEVHSRLTKKCNEILNRRRREQELCRNTLVEHSTVNLSYHSRLFQEARGVVINRPISIVTRNKSTMIEVQSQLARSSERILGNHRIDCERSKNALVEHSSRMLSNHLGLVHYTKGTILNRPIGIVARKKSEFIEVHSQLVQRCGGIVVRRLQELSTIHTSIVNFSKHSIHRSRTELSDCIAKNTLVPRNVIRGNQTDLHNLIAKLKTNVNHILRLKEDSLRAEESVCRLMSPVNILKKGFAIVYADDKVITDGNKIRPLDNLSVRLIDARINVTVTEKIKINGTEFDL